jgi:hypothetical protein
VTPDTRELDRFWKQLERLRVEDMMALAARPLDVEAHAVAVEHAGDGARRLGLEKSIAATTADIDAWVVALFNRSTVQPGWYEANWGRPGSATDRANLAASLGEVASALLLGAAISVEDRDELLGAWASLIEPT